MSRVVDLKTAMDLQKAAPIGAAVPSKLGKLVAEYLSLSVASDGYTDLEGGIYWVDKLSEILTDINGRLENEGAEAISARKLGAVCRSFQLVMTRKGDGYYVAYSENQLDILSVFFAL